MRVVSWKGIIVPEIVIIWFTGVTLATTPSTTTLRDPGLAPVACALPLFLRQDERRSNEMNENTSKSVLKCVPDPELRG
jgi:hypothetical protein